MVDVPGLAQNATLVVLAALLAPALLWGLWRLQALAVDRGLRAGMFRLLRRHSRLYDVVSWFGVLLHELSHATFLLLGGHGIRGFKVGVDAGHVRPARVRSGWYGTLTFALAAVAPMFAAPLAIVLVLDLLVTPTLLGMPDAGPGATSALVHVFWPAVQRIATDLPMAILSLDVTTWTGAVVIGLVVFAMPSARPSHVKGEGGEADEGDIVVVRRHIRSRPWPFVVVGVLVLAAYGLVWWQPGWYWGAWTLLWSTSLAAILLALLGGIAWATVARTGRIQPWLAWLPFVLALAAQIVPRVVAVPGLPASLSAFWMNLATLGLFVASTFLFAAVAPRR